MKDSFALPEGFLWEDRGEEFRLRAPLTCPVSQARCLAVTAASWVRAALGADTEILWPTHVVRGEARLCGLTCRAGEGYIAFVFRPEPGAVTDPAAFREGVLRAAARDLAGYPENQPELLSRYCEHCRTVMKFVRTSYRGVPVYGFAFAVDKHGGLMVMTQESHTVITLYGGEAEIVRGDDVPPTVPDLPKSPGS